MQRIQSLDGLRAVSILLVLLGHSALMFTNSPLVAQWAVVGVRIFFPISGLLITLLLKRELEASSTISLRNFYIRRSLRIFPLAYLFIATVGLLYWARILKSSAWDLATAASYMVSYRIAPLPNMGHLWSLSVEEQFYLLWPAVFLVSRRHARTVCLAVILASPLIRALWWYLLPQYRMGIGHAFPTIMDSIAFGCLVALDQKFVEKISRIPALAILTAPVVAWALLAMPFLMPAGPVRAGIRLVADSLIGLVLACFVAWFSLTRKQLIPFLNWKPMVYIGVVSYSIYIWQEPFVERKNVTWPSALVGLAAIFAVSVAAHYAVEKPFLKLKERFGFKRVAVASAL